MLIQCMWGSFRSVDFTLIKPEAFIKLNKEPKAKSPSFSPSLPAETYPRGRLLSSTRFTNESWRSDL